MNVPIIRLEFEGMRNTMQLALSEFAAQIDADLQKAVATFCTPENLQGIILAEAHQQLAACLREEVRNFFSYTGNGRAAVREAVTELLNERYPLKD